MTKNQGSTPREARYTSDSEMLVRDGRIGRYGLVFLDDLDSEEVRTLKGSAFRVYVTLTPFARKGSGEAYPLQTTIAKITGLVRQTVNTAIRDLIAAGLLAKAVQKRPGRNDLIVYTLLRPPSRRPKHLL